MAEGFWKQVKKCWPGSPRWTDIWAFCCRYSMWIASMLVITVILVEGYWNGWSWIFDQLGSSEDRVYRLITIIAGTFAFILAICRSVTAEKHANATAKQAEIAVKGQHSERFARAVELVANDQLEIRLGGIVSLDALSLESEKEYLRVWNYLSDFLRYSSAPKGWEESRIEGSARPEIKRIAVMLRNRHKSLNPSAGVVRLLDLNNVNLYGADLRGVNLSRSNLEEADLEYADLSESDLRNATLCGANMREANLNHAKLAFTLLMDANLEGAMLISADFQEGTPEHQSPGGRLQRANLQKANLRDVKLQGINLEWANLVGADLVGASFEGAKIGGVLFGGKYQHLFPSTIKKVQAWSATSRLLPKDLTNTYYDAKDPPNLPSDTPIEWPKKINRMEWEEKKESDKSTEGLDIFWKERYRKKRRAMVKT